MKAVLDTSAIVKHYALEPGHDQLEQALELIETPVISRLCAIELVATFYRLVRTRRLTEATCQDLIAVFDGDCQNVFDVYPLTDALTLSTLETVRRAQTLPLRAADAIHIQTALDAGADRFVTGDRQQAAAADALGLTVTRLGDG
ncbi:MAG: type II toxin-antitoxin system VapC family toxin [Pseudomonadota bacterium]